MSDGQTPEPARGSRDFFESSQFNRDRVFELELEAINADRTPPDNHGASKTQPDTRHQLVGLALSGGGIRSASFSLGVVQALHENEMFKEVDYLSTVSGGGYTGSCISALKAQGKPLPFSHTTGVLEHVAFRHLRDHSNYLAPGKTGRFLRIPALVFQGMLRNFLALLPAALVAVLAVWPYSGAIKEALQSRAAAFGIWHYLPIVIGVFAMLAWTIFSPRVAQKWIEEARTPKEQGNASSGASPREIRDKFLVGTTVIFVGLLLFVFINIQPYAIVLVTEYRYGLPIATVASGTGLAAIAAKLAQRAANVAMDKVGDKLLMVGLALLGPLTLWLIVLLLGSWAISPPKPLFEAFKMIVGSSGALAQCLTLNEGTPPIACHEFTNTAMAVYLIAALILLVVFIWRYDVNAASLHNFYRDRLSAAFLFAYEDKDAFAPTSKSHPHDNIKLSGLSTRRPVHLINAAINIQDSQERNMRGRNADFFLFSRQFTGGEYTGYAETKELEKHDRHLDLGAAMAISGAAIAPNSGIHTNRALRFLMMMANARLGYWMLNPRRLNAAKSSTRLPRLNALYFFDELRGRLSEDRDYIYVTDGADIENLGAFELLRRRCKYIVVADATCDPDMAFGALAQLIRLSRIDLGVNIDIDVTDLRKTEIGMVRSHCALGTIRYGNGQVGQLLFIKASVSGDENPYISEYRARHPDFPHENTTDQFFDETQFEAYRALGHHITSGLFESRHSEERAEVGMQSREDDDVIDSNVGAWFHRLSRWLRPRPADLDEFLEIQQAAAALERRFADPRYAQYFAQIHEEYTDIGPSQAATEEARRQGLNLVRDQLYLIERAVMKLQLDDPSNRVRSANRGLMNMFRRWSQTDLFRYGWAACIADFTPDLQRFCREALDLKCAVHWRRVDRLVRKDGLNSYEFDHYAARYPDAQIYMARLYVEAALPAESDAAAPMADSLIRRLTSGDGAQAPKSPLIEFDVATAYVARKSEGQVMLCLRIRDTYRGQNLTMRLASELRTTIGARSEPFYYVLDTEDPDLAAALHLTLRKAGFAPYPSEGIDAAAGEPKDTKAAGPA